MPSPAPPPRLSGRRAPSRPNGARTRRRHRPAGRPRRRRRCMDMPSPQPGLPQNLPDHAHGGRLAVRAGDRDRPGSGPARPAGTGCRPRPRQHPVAWPSAGDRCIRRPGHAFSSSTAHGWARPRPAGSCSGAPMSASRTSMPQMSSPDSAAARRHMSATSACTRSVTSLLVPPVDRFALRRSVTAWPSAGTEWSSSPSECRWLTASASSRIAVSSREWPAPRRGSVLACRYQLPDRAGSVPGDRRRAQLGRGRDPPVDDQDPVVRARHQLLDEHGVAGGARPSR